MTTFIRAKCMQDLVDVFRAMWPLSGYRLLRANHLQELASEYGKPLVWQTITRHNIGRVGTFFESQGGH